MAFRCRNGLLNCHCTHVILWPDFQTVRALSSSQNQLFTSCYDVINEKTISWECNVWFQNFLHQNWAEPLGNKQTVNFVFLIHLVHLFLLRNKMLERNDWVLLSDTTLFENANRQPLFTDSQQMWCKNMGYHACYPKKDNWHPDWQ